MQPGIVKKTIGRMVAVNVRISNAKIEETNPQRDVV